MTKNNENNQENSLKAWATGRITSIALGLAVVYFIYKTDMINKAFGFFKPDLKGKGVKSDETSTKTDSSSSTKVG